MQCNSRSYNTQGALCLTAPVRPACLPLHKKTHSLTHAVALLQHIQPSIPFIFQSETMLSSVLAPRRACSSRMRPSGVSTCAQCFRMSAASVSEKPDRKCFMTSVSMPASATAFGKGSRTCRRPPQ
jgi:hypothetical protein